MKKIYITTSTLFSVILVGLSAVCLVYDVFKVFKNFPLAYIIVIKKKTKSKSKTELSLFSAFFTYSEHAGRF